MERNDFGVQAPSLIQWRWHLDEAFVKINGKLRYLWSVVDDEGEVLDAVVTTNRDKVAALKLLKRIMKKYGSPRTVVIASPGYGTDAVWAANFAPETSSYVRRQGLGRS
jgi:transposase-like protein